MNPNSCDQCTGNYEELKEDKKENKYKSVLFKGVVQIFSSGDINKPIIFITWSDGEALIRLIDPRDGEGMAFTANEWQSIRKTIDDCIG